MNRKQMMKQTKLRIAVRYCGCRRLIGWGEDEERRELTRTHFHPRASVTYPEGTGAIKLEA
jgi:hypothetical protein